MTELSPIERRDALRARIEAAERRNADRTLSDKARDAAGGAMDYTRAHPFTVIGGAVAAGVAIGLLTKPGRKVARSAANRASGALAGAGLTNSSSAKSLAARGGSKISNLVGEAAVTYVLTLIDDAMDNARAAQERAADFGDSAGNQAKKLGANAADAASSAADSTRALARKASTAAVDAMRDLARKTKR